MTGRGSAAEALGRRGDKGSGGRGDRTQGRKDEEELRRKGGGGTAKSHN